MQWNYEQRGLFNKTLKLKNHFHTFTITWSVVHKFLKIMHYSALENIFLKFVQFNWKYSGFYVVSGIT